MTKKIEEFSIFFPIIILKFYIDLYEKSALEQFYRIFLLIDHRLLSIVQGVPKNGFLVFFLGVMWRGVDDDDDDELLMMVMMTIMTMTTTVMMMMTMMMITTTMTITKAMRVMIMKKHVFR